MISSASWDESTRVNYSEANQIARARRASLICSLKNDHLKLHEKSHTSAS